MSAFDRGGFIEDQISTRIGSTLGLFLANDTSPFLDPLLCQNKRLTMSAVAFYYPYCFAAITIAVVNCYRGNSLLSR